MKILILKMERKNDGCFAFVPSLPEEGDNTIIFLPENITHILIQKQEGRPNITHIFAVDSSELQ